MVQNKTLCCDRARIMGDMVRRNGGV